MDASPPKRRRPDPVPRLYDQEAPGDAPDIGDAITLTSPPAVVAVLVTGGRGDLEPTLRSLRDQDYPNLAVLVIGTGAADDLTSRVAAVLPSAYIRLLDHDPGFAAAANEALAAVEGAPFLLFCRDHVVFDPHAVGALVEEAFRSNAGLVGPKFVDRDHPEMLLEVGLAIDKFGATYSGIEPGEIDQEQHDAVRDVFYISSAAMLVRTDLLRAIGGFDPACGSAGDDLDVCWRARLAGARVLVVPDARVTRPAGDLALTANESIAENRNRIRTMLKSYSVASLLRILPQAIVITIIEAVALVAMRRRAQASAVLDGWTWNLRHTRSLRHARRATQQTRVVADADVRFLQVTGSARARDFILGRIEHGSRARAFVRSSRDIVDATTERLQWTTIALWVALVVVPLFGVRELVTHGVPGVGSILPWPGVPALAKEFTSTWRFSGLGAASPQPTAFAVLSVVGSVFLGATSLVHTLVIAIAIPAGIMLTFRLARSCGLASPPSVAAAVAYGVNPVARNAIANGRFGAVLLFALAPLLVQRVINAGKRDGLVRRDLVSFALVVALLASVAPVNGLFAPIAALPLLVVAGVTRGWKAGRGPALSLVLPGSDPASAGFVFRPHLDLGAVLRFHTGPAGRGSLSYALAVVALIAVMIANGEKLRVAAQGWSLAVAGFALTFVAGQRWGGGPWPAPESMLILAALGLALAVGAGVAAFVEDLPRTSVGWRHAAAVAGGVALVLASCVFVTSTRSGRFGLPTRGWSSTLSWMDTRRGEFRVLWAGDASVLPLDGWSLRDGTSYGITRNGPGDVRALWPISADGTTALVADALHDAIDGRTNRLGHLLAPMGVRYVAVPLRRGPQATGRAVREPRLTEALAGQLDLRGLPIQRDLVLYENTAWIPIGAIVRAPATRGGETLVTEIGEPTTALGAHGWNGASARTRHDGQLLWSESFDSSWRASVGGHRVAHRRVFGWANGFVVNRTGHVVVRHRGLLLALGELLLTLLLWGGAVILWWRSRRRDRAPVVAPQATDEPVRVVAAPATTLDLPMAATEVVS